MNFLSRNMFFDLARTAWRYAGDFRPRMALFYVLFLVANAFVVLQPLVLARIINLVQAGGAQGEVIRHILFWACVYGGLTLLFWALHGPARVIERRLAFVVYKNFVADLYRSVTEMPLKWHQDHHSGDTINRINKAGNALFNFAQVQFLFIFMAVRFCASLAVLGFYSPGALAASLASSLVIMVLIRRFDRALVPLLQTGNEREHAVNATLFDYISNVITILTLRLQENTRAEVDAKVEAVRPPFRRSVLLNEYKWFAVNTLLVVTQVGIVAGYIFAHLWRHEALALGAVVAIFQYLLVISDVFYTGANAYSDLMQRHTNVHAVDPLLADHARLAAKADSGAAAPWHGIKIEDLHFTHQEGEDALHHLRGVNLTIAPGEKIALVGSSGAGKTTLLTLLRGLYEAPRVRLSIDGRDYGSLRPLADFTTLVPQDAEIFENTVRYNLTLGTEVPAEDLQRALDVTTFTDVLPGLPQGIETDIRERGVNLSGGQKQRLALARGLIAARNSSLLLLDEPTSSIDLATEAAIFDRLFASYGDKAIVASIHRLHLLPRFGRIVLMEGGMVLEQGSFLDLIGRRGAFYRLWQQHLEQGAGGETG